MLGVLCVENGQGLLGGKVAAAGKNEVFHLASIQLLFPSSVEVLEFSSFKELPMSVRGFAQVRKKKQRKRLFLVSDAELEPKYGCGEIGRDKADR